MDEQTNPELLSSFLVGVYFCIFHRLEFKIDIITFMFFFASSHFYTKRACIFVMQDIVT